MADASIISERLTTALRDLEAALVVRSAWLPGMVGWVPHEGEAYTVTALGDDGAVWCDGGPGGTMPDGARVVELDSAATRGCLLALAREAWEDPTLCVRYVGPASPVQAGPWEVVSTSRSTWMAICAGDTELEALEAAISRRWSMLDETASGRSR